MATLYMRRFIIVVRADLVAQANIAANHASWDPDGAGDKTFTVALSASGIVPAQAYWCDASLTSGMAGAVKTRLMARGATDAETTLIPLGQTPASNRFAVFDADAGWTPTLVLIACGLQRIGGTP